MKFERLNLSEIIFKILAYVLVILFAIVALYPVVYAVSASISGRVAYQSGQVVLFPKDTTFLVYEILFRDKGFWMSYVNTLFYTIFGTAWSMLVSCAGAYALSKDKLLFRRKFNLFVVFTMWFSAGMIPSYLNYIQMGTNSRWGFIFSFGIQAFNVILLRSYFESVPKEIEEAAIIDGASEFGLFAKIYIPMSKAAIATVTLFYATSRWNGFFWANLLMTDQADKPLQVYMKQQIDQLQKIIDEHGELDYAADSFLYAILVCSIIPVLIIYPFIQKYFAKGTNVGGVKG